MVFEVLFTSSLLIIGIFVIRRLTRGKISMRLRYMLWLFAALRLLFPVSVGNSPFSVMNLLPADFRGDTEIVSTGGINEWKGQEMVPGQEQMSAKQMKNEAEDDLPFDGQLVLEERESALPFGETGRPEMVQKANADSLAERFPRALLPGLLWFAGFLAVGGYMLVMRLRFTHWLTGRRQQVLKEDLPAFFGGRLAKRGMRVYLVKNLPSPCLVGRRIYVGEQVFAESRSFSHILAHEYCHAVHGDAFWAFLRCALAAVYWFDPFVWAAVYAAKQDCELACDEAAVRLLGEGERFSYGRTLLSLLEKGEGREKCPGMSFMTAGGERSVKERIVSLTGGVKTKGAAFAAVLAVMVFFCGCAFTGADQDKAEKGSEEMPQVVGMEEDEAAQKLREEGLAVNSDVSGTKRQTSADGENGEFERIKEEYEKNVEQIREVEAEAKEAAKQAADQAAFEEVLNYHGVMEGKDDGELLLNRKVDYQACYEFFSLGEEGENPMENGWYLLCENVREGIFVYGLYTDTFGFRGLKTKTLPGGDVNTYDSIWYPTVANEREDNIRVLERDTNGLARRFVFKLMASESSEVEMWRLYRAFQYDTGTIDMKMFSAEDLLDYAGQHLSFQLDQEAGQVKVSWDQEELPDTLDISEYNDFEIEGVEVNQDVLSFGFSSEAYETQGEDGFDGIVVYLSLGLRLKDSDELWVYRLEPLTLQFAEDEGELGFSLRKPKFEGVYMTQQPLQEKKLSQMRDAEA